MTTTAIHVAGLSKRYRIGQRERYRTIRQTLSEAVSRPFREWRRSSEASERGVTVTWALRDVWFDVGQGEVVGIVGRNGAGKTTLLRILSSITEPTDGFADINGRVGSLLEVGTGFNPELTGRENTYLNGSILGMRKVEIDRRFGEIVAFAEIDRFLDTPVKHYSSGMQTRLAFSVAAHLEPEILLVDEVLAVGDIAFQQKCLGKMDTVARGGRTILFVSHQMNQVRRLCNRVVWLEDGGVRAIGPANEVVSAYEANSSQQSGINGTDRLGTADSRFVSWTLLGAEAGAPNVLADWDPFTVTFRFDTRRPIRSAHHGIALFDSAGHLIWGTAADRLTIPVGTHTFAYEIRTLPLRPGTYTWRVTLYDAQGLVDSWECLPALIIDTPPTGHRSDEWAGMLNLQYEFTLEQLTADPE